MNYRSSNYFSRIFYNRQKVLFPGWSTRGVFAECPGVSRGCLHGATERAPGWFPGSGHVAHSGASGVLLGGSLGTRGVLGRSPGETPGESVFGTRGLLGGLPDVVYGLGTRGHVSLGKLPEGMLSWFRHSGQMASSGDIRG